MRGDFSELPIKLEHLEIYLNFIQDHVLASNTLTMTVKEPISELELDAKDLEIFSVDKIEDSQSQPLKWSYKKDEAKLVVKLDENYQPGRKLVIKTVTKCIPSDFILEGIYKDSTPPGAPQQYISQCQQWGFQRIMPIFDDCRAKCRMTTTIEADAAYVRLISNGNISRKKNPDGKPTLKPDDSTRQIIIYENNTPMAPYLFLVAVGTWDTLVDHVTYNSGKTVRLEYLVPPGRSQNALIPMEILKESVLWVAKTQDYEYTADTYRTICMNKSNFGGMENVGNTTIVTDAALIDEHTLDQSLIYAHAVIVHEFEHNQCGSETTMDTPFDVWLNEAYTVDVERAFMADVFDPAFMRLNQVDSIRSPLLGPLAIEDGGSAGKIVREGFNDPDDLIDGVTYVKAAEVIRMLRLLIGVDKFKEGKTLYFTRYKNSNADTNHFFQCFEEVSGRDLSQFKKGWLYRIGYPKVTANTVYDPETKSLILDLSQEAPKDGAPFHFPLDIALISEQGEEFPNSRKTLEIKQLNQKITIENVPERPAYASLNRDYSFYGTFTQTDLTPAILEKQAAGDTNAFNRVEAMRRLTDIERIGLLNDPQHQVSDSWLRLYGSFLTNTQLGAGLKTYFIRIEEQPFNRAYFTWFPELADVREKLMLSLNSHFYGELLSQFQSIDTYSPQKPPIEGIEDRILKHILLDLLSVADTTETHSIILDHFNKAVTMQEKVSALAILNRTSYADTQEMLDRAYLDWRDHISGYANYLRIIGSGTRDDVFESLENERRRHTFDINHPTWSRALFLPMASNNKMVWKPEGIDWVADTVIDLAKINGYVAGKLLNTFQQYKNLKPKLQELVRPALEKIIEQTPADVSSTINGQAKAYLE